MARNVVGWSQYSDWNSIDDSYTITAPPETPRNPLAISGSWNSLKLKVTIPFCNG
jgi:hypothetical protein